MIMSKGQRRWRFVLANLGLVALLAIGTIIGAGCGPKAPPPPTSEPYATLPLAPVPGWMHGTVFEQVVVGNAVNKRISGYSLVVNLDGTGDGTAPTFVRNYISKRIQLHGLGSDNLEQYRTMKPDEILNDKRVAVVMVEGELPPGAREGQAFDLTVRAMPRSRTTSLAGGRLYDTELSERGAEDPQAVGANVLAYAHAGEVFVNPAYAFNGASRSDVAAAASLKTGTVIDGGRAKFNRPIYLQLRAPQGSTARLIEALVRRRFPYLSKDVPWEVARSVAAKDEGVIELYVPDEFRGDWRHYVGVVTHIFLNDNPAFVVAKAQELVRIAHQPDAPLQDISYCWEAMGEEGMTIFGPLISDPDPAIAYAAARAAAFTHDGTARKALLAMASDPSNPFQLNAVQTLGSLDVTLEIRHMLRTLLDSDHASVRLEAYRILTRDSEAIFSKKVKNGFFVDVIDDKGPPLVYASRTGVPRVAVFGRHIVLQSPLLFMGMNQRLTITSTADSDLLTMFYRDPTRVESRTVQTNNDLAEIISRMGGEGPDQASTFDFSYGDVVAILQKLSDDHLLVGDTRSGGHVQTAFLLERPTMSSDTLTSVGEDTTLGAGRPQGQHPPDDANAPQTRPGVEPGTRAEGEGNTPRPGT